MPRETLLPLSGQRFLVTRPEGQAEALLTGIRALGGEPTHIPFLAIEPVADMSALHQIAEHLDRYRACFFVSANAVRCAWPVLAEAGWPPQLAGAAVGPGTANALRRLGVSQVVVPAQRFDSEGLLAEAFFAEAQCHGQAFALIRGEGGRDFMAQTLRARGARVDEAAVYRRCLHPEVLPRLAEWLAADQSTQDTLLISSSESLLRVMDNAPPALAAALRRCAVLAPHPKIAGCAQRLDFAQVATSEGGDAGLLDALSSYNAISKTLITNITHKTEMP